MNHALSWEAIHEHSGSPPHALSCVIFSPFPFPKDNLKYSKCRARSHACVFISCLCVYWDFTVRVHDLICCELRISREGFLLWKLLFFPTLEYFPAGFDRKHTQFISGQGNAFLSSVNHIGKMGLCTELPCILACSFILPYCLFWLNLQFFLFCQENFRPFKDTASKASS